MPITSRPNSCVAVCLTSLLVLACTDDGASVDDDNTVTSETTTGDGDGDGDPGDGDGETETGEPGPCDALVDGLNQDFEIDGIPRSFYLDLPTDVETGGPWPVVFAWHGLGDTADNFHNLFGDAVDGPQLSFIAVTPEDTDHEVTVPLVGAAAFDWDTFMIAEDGLGNKEVALFDTILGCLDTRWGVDLDRVHSAGFSLGAVTTDMLASVRGEQLASIATWSGGYWNNGDNLGLALNTVASWPEHDVQNPYAQLLIHGGLTDEFVVLQNVYVMSFYAFTLADTAFLSSLGHPLVVCDHGAGHTAPGSVSPATVLSFFAAHPLGVGASPWIDAPPVSGLEDCSFALTP
jgi:polyhydroxybutyrate depolymerase